MPVGKNWGRLLFGKFKSTKLGSMSLRPQLTYRFLNTSRRRFLRRP